MKEMISSRDKQELQPTCGCNLVELLEHLFGTFTVDDVCMSVANALETFEFVPFAAKLGGLGIDEHNTARHGHLLEVIKTDPSICKTFEIVNERSS